MRDKTKNYDFAGWVTKNNVKCSDGRTIRQNAFAHMDGKRVSLVYNHNHEDLDNVLGYVDLENRENGVYGYAKCANTDMGNTAKELVHSGSLVSFSIYANNLSEKNGDVMHGDIKEVSLVLAGANKEALIDTFFEHGVDGETGMYFYNGEGDCEFTEDFLSHADEDEDEEDEKEVEEEVEESEEESEEEESDKDEKKKEIKHSDEGNDEESEGGQTLAEAYEEMPDKYKKVCAALVGMATAEDSDEVEHSDEGGEVMKNNLFENEVKEQENVLEHSDIQEIMTVAKSGSKTLKQAFNDYCLAHSIDTTGMNILPNQATSSQTYGVRDLDMLFPEYKAQSNIPEFIKRDTTWVDVVNAGVKKVPFKRIKSMFANITEDEARAKGYIKGDQKAPEVFELLGRTTDPQTIYKLQQLDRDDIIDIEDFDVVAWIKAEMQIMLAEEKARAILIGDGRSANNRHKIKEDHVRPIATDVPLFNIKVNVNVAADADEDATYKEFKKAVLRGRKQYKGSGNPTLFTTEEVLTELLLLEDKMGHPLYKTETELATALRVNKIVTVEVMENQTVDSKPLLGVIVNLNDYTVGGDGNREKGMFEDFDIDFNQYKYLIETRMSGALTKPYSAMTILLNRAAAQQAQG
ncbi:MAG: phage major capsid protein [Bacilli bacterium]|nr:phage major capsid protein [Bacilli bacterium]